MIPCDRNSCPWQGPKLLGGKSKAKISTPAEHGFGPCGCVHDKSPSRPRYGGNGVTDFALPKLPPVTPSGPFYFICIGGSPPPQG